MFLSFHSYYTPVLKSCNAGKFFFPVLYKNQFLESTLKRYG